MSKASIFMLVALATLLLANHHVSSQLTEPTFRYAFCLGDTFGNYTTNSTYASNLKTVVSTLENQASTMSFYNTSAGNGSDTVYGQYYCRGDVDSDFCSNCIHAATSYALNCSNAKGAIIWFNECTLRYENVSMYGKAPQNLRLRSRSLLNVTDPENFFIALNDTMVNLIHEVGAGYADNSVISHYATGEAKVSPFETVYCLVQCSPDINAAQCDTCLRDAYYTVLTCCGEYPKRVYIFYESCQVMYYLDPFYFNRNAPPAPVPPPPSPPNSPSLDFLVPPPPIDDTVSVFRPPPPRANGASALLVNKSLMFGIIFTTALALFVLMFDQ